MTRMPSFLPALSAVRRTQRRVWGACCIAVSAMLSLPAHAEPLVVAVAANFASPFQQISKGFSAATGHQLVVSTGSTGKLHAQVRNGAPFALLIAADDETPAKLIAEGLAVQGSSFTYAMGRLVLWSAKPGYVDAKGDVLKQADFKHLALANPKLAPYGVAAVEVLAKLGLTDKLRSRLVQGENIAQAHQFVATGNAELGFVALSQVAVPGKPQTGSAWVVPTELYAPIRQNAVLLKKGANQAAAQALLSYLRSDAAKAVIRHWGYGL